jgi:hypothetical protein
VGAQALLTAEFKPLVSCGAGSNANGTAALMTTETRLYQAVIIAVGVANGLSAACQQLCQHCCSGFYKPLPMLTMLINESMCSMRPIHFCVVVRVFDGVPEQNQAA